MGIESYSTTAANNNSASPNGFPEGMAPSGVNDSARQVMADIRSWYEAAEWVEYGDTVAYSSGTEFTVSGNLTDRYAVSRRVKAVGSLTGTIYGIISASSYSAPNTTVTVVWDSGSLSNEALTICVGIVGPTNSSLDIAALAGLSDFIGAGLTFNSSTKVVKANIASVSSVTLAGDSTVAFTDLASGYDYWIRIRNLKATADGVPLIVRTSTNNGSSYDSSSGNYRWSSNLTFSGSDTEINIDGTQSIGNDAGETVNLDIHITDPSASEYCNISWLGAFTVSSGTLQQTFGTGQRLTAADVDAIQISMPGTTMASGQIELYEVKQA